MSLIDFEYDFKHQFSELHGNTSKTIETHVHNFITNPETPDVLGFTQAISNLIESNVSKLLCAYNTELINEIHAELEELKK